MKKLVNKLLFTTLTAPIILSTSAITSCAKEAEIIEMHDVHNYKPIQDLLPYGEFSQIDIINNYMVAVNNKPEIFESDIISSFDEIYYDTLAECLSGFTLTSCKMGVTNPVFGTTTAWEDGFDDLEYPTVSFRQRLQLTYEKDSSTGDEYKTVREITLNVSYTDVIFYISEKSNQLGWGVGIYDQNIGSESLWAYERDSKPWSINFDCSDIEKKIIPLVSGGEDIIINKSSYFSHVIDTTDRLQLLSELVIHLLPDQTPNLEQVIVKIILLLDIKSHFLSETDNLFDLRITQQLSGQISGTINAIFGFKLLIPKALGKTPGIKFFDNLEETARITWPTTESDISCTEIGGGGRKLTFDVKTIGEQYKYIRLNLTPDNEGNWNVDLPFTINWTGTPGERIAFDINKNKFDIEFRYYRVDAQGHSTTESIKITTYLHYNTINVHVVI